MDRSRAKLQLALVRAVVRGARKQGGLSAELRERATEIVEFTAVEVQPESDEELLGLLAAVKAEVDAE